MTMTKEEKIQIALGTMQMYKVCIHYKPALYLSSDRYNIIEYKTKIINCDAVAVDAYAAYWQVLLQLYANHSKSIVISKAWARDVVTEQRTVFHIFEYTSNWTTGFAETHFSVLSYVDIGIVV